MVYAAAIPTDLDCHYLRFWNTL